MIGIWCSLYAFGEMLLPRDLPLLTQGDQRGGQTRPHCAPRPCPGPWSCPGLPPVHLARLSDSSLGPIWKMGRGRLGVLSCPGAAGSQLFLFHVSSIDSKTVRLTWLVQKDHVSLTHLPQCVFPVKACLSFMAQ